MVAHKRIKTTGKSLNFQAQKVVAVIYRWWSFTRDSNCKSLTGKVLVFWIGRCSWEVVAYERWPHMEVDLHYMVRMFLALLQDNFNSSSTYMAQQ